MTTKIVSQVDKLALVAGLSWHPLVQQGKQQPAEIRSILADNDAVKIATITSYGNTTLGLYNPGDDEDDTPDEKKVKPNKFHSLALAFAAFVGEGNAVLAYQLPNSPLAAIILIESGRPVVDDVKLVETVQTLSSNYFNGSTGFAYSFFTNDVENFRAGTHIDDQKLWECTGKDSLLVNKPINFKALLILLLVAGVVVGGGFGYSVYSKDQKKRALAAQAKKDNPVLKYQNEIGPRLSAIGLSSNSVIAVLNKLGNQPIIDSGWDLKSIACTFASNQCISTWKRNGGTTNELINSRKVAGEEILGESTMEESQFRIKMPIKLSGVNAQTDFPEATVATKIGIPIYQVLQNAGVEIKVNADGYKLWPSVPGVNADNIPPDVAIQSRGAEVSSSVPLLIETLKTLPNNYLWNEMKIDFQESTPDALSLMRVTVKGDSYVR